MKTTLKATALIAALAAAGSATAMTFSDAGGQFRELASELTNHAASPNAWASEIRGNQNDLNIEIIGLSELGAGGQALNDYLDTVRVDLREFQSAVGGKAPLSARLHANGYAPTDVVAYKSVGSRNIRLIVDDIR